MDGGGGGNGNGGFLVDPIIKRLCYASPPAVPAAVPAAAVPNAATRAASFSHIAFPALPDFHRKSRMFLPNGTDSLQLCVVVLNTCV